MTRRKHEAGGGTGAQLWRQAKKIIPGGNQLLSKRAEMFLPELWPAYYQKAKGAYVWDLDGRRLIDMSIMGIGTCPLGYCHPSVNRAVKRAIDQGSMSTLNCPEEVTLTRKLFSLHPWAQMARYARTGGEACAIAVRIARAFTGKDQVLFSGYHGWSDWYLAANLTSKKGLDDQLLPGLKPRGVPSALAQTAIPFVHGDIDGFKQKVKLHKGKIGVIILEVQRHNPLDVPFLKQVRKIANQVGAVLIFDEITSGFRQYCGGVHMLTGIAPDIVLLGKALGNGFPITAILGKANVMKAAQTTFISSTYWTERIGFVAALETIRAFQSERVSRYLNKIGTFFHKKLTELIKKHGLNMTVEGTPANPILVIRESQALHYKTYFIQEMLARGFLASTVIYLSLVHNKTIIDRYMKNAREVFRLIGRAIREGTLKKSLQGPVCHSGFRRLN